LVIFPTFLPMALPQDYRHKGSIGDGYFCNVSKYHSSADNCTYAVKKLKREFLDNAEYRTRFLREIELLKALEGHDCIVELKAHEPNHLERELWYAMPVANQNLFHYIRQNNSTIDLTKRIGIFEHVLSGITHAHSQSILHRDISANNVLVFEEEDGLRAKLSDFGLGKDTEAMNYIRSSANGFGQVLYVSPEQKDHLKHADFRSDIYALGKLLYFVMTGKDPIDFKTCPFITLIRKATSGEPIERFQTIEEFNSEFESMKQFLLNPEIPRDRQVMRDFLSGNTQVNWDEFHEVAIIANSDNHVYHDYLKPIVALFNTRSNLEAYYSAKQGALLHFVEVFNSKVRECTQSHNWPFRALDDFGLILYHILKICQENEIKLLCLCEIWNIAYEDDQFAVQNNFKTIMNNNMIPSEIEAEFAAHIVSSKTRGITMAKFSEIRLPTAIKRAIIQIARTPE